MISRLFSSTHDNSPLVNFRLPRISDSGLTYAFQMRRGSIRSEVLG